jgi:hypothetical protein
MRVILLLALVLLTQELSAQCKDFSGSFSDPTDSSCYIIRQKYCDELDILKVVNNIYVSEDFSYTNGFSFVDRLGCIKKVKHYPDQTLRTFLYCDPVSLWTKDELTNEGNINRVTSADHGKTWSQTILLTRIPVCKENK